jgi:hypothetical protein
MTPWRKVRAAASSACSAEAQGLAGVGDDADALDPVEGQAAQVQDVGLVELEAEPSSRCQRTSAAWSPDPG